MLVTRTEWFVDWHHQGAHMGEVETANGNGLLHGYIYFRYSDDFLKAGETIKRSMSFITLSDGSTYELGKGEAASKVTITDHGVSPSGEVTLEVHGVGDLGIGVSSISRHVTIEYDDGKVPVLDTEQLDSVLGDLSENLTNSMVSTANAIKEELRLEMNTLQVDVRQECTQSAQATLNELDTRLATVQGDMVSRIEASATTTKRDAINGSRAQTTQWTIGQYTVGANSWNNLSYAVPTLKQGDSFVTHSTANNSFIVSRSAVTFPRTLTVTFSLYMTLAVEEQVITFALMDISGGVLCMTPMVLKKAGHVAGSANTARVQASLQLFLGGQDANHPVLKAGCRAGIYNGSGENLVAKEGSNLIFTLS